MTILFEELAHSKSPFGDLSLRRRHELRLNTDVYEIKLGDDFLMTSLFHKSEDALADLGLQKLKSDKLNVVIGGLGLGYTAATALKNPKIHDLIVIEILPAVIKWHRADIIPMNNHIKLDKRCRFVEGDFFSLVQSKDGFDPDNANRRFHAILVDIDHSPNQWLASTNSFFYRKKGLSAITQHLLPGGVFGLWSNDAPDTTFTERLALAVGKADARAITFENPLTGTTVTQTVYIATAP
tara:strand:+ start:108 stop:824 length:717 start_codon:yes stop_codon:yes gene_type:complete